MTKKLSIMTFLMKKLPPPSTLSSSLQDIYQYTIHMIANVEEEEETLKLIHHQVRLHHLIASQFNNKWLIRGMDKMGRK